MPAAIVETEVLKDAVRTACRAPSLYNMQPWRWVLDGDELRLFLDPSRVLVSDRFGREAVIGCGAALDHLRVAMAAAGQRTTVDRLPNPDDRNYLAAVHFSPMDEVTEGHRRRAEAIWGRRSDRSLFNPPDNWQALEPVLHNCIDGYHVRLDVLSDDVRPRLAQASEFTESLRLYDSTYHAELARWVAPFVGSEGIPYSSLASTAGVGQADVGRVFPVTHHHEPRTQVAKDQSKILVLSTDSDDRADALATGEALSIVLLECTMAGLASCPLTHLTEVAFAREIITTLVGGDVVPQILLRVGQAHARQEPPPPTSRRPVEDVLLVSRGDGHHA